MTSPNDKAAIRSKKFVAFIITLAVMAFLGERGMALNTPSDLMQSVLFTIFLLGGGYVGSTAWLDRGVRMAGVLKGKDEANP
jgi:hypothetical protein